jgi:hypothetical protein
LLRVIKLDPGPDLNLDPKPGHKPLSTTAMHIHAGSSPQSHPYFPQDAIIPGYAPNSSPLLAILGAFGGIVGAFVLGCVTLAKWYSPGLKRADQLTVAWFALCECAPFFRSLPHILLFDQYTY